MPNDWSRAMLLSSHPTYSPLFSQPSFNHRPHPPRVWSTCTTDWCCYASTHVSLNNAHGKHVHTRWLLSTPSFVCRLDTFRPLGKRKGASRRRTQNPLVFELTPSTDRETEGRVRSKPPGAGSSVW
ncbi:hypothetical protein NPIL_29221 [Nephila pilipes]|uniref:Uncharacterized protein n=1 Tax=Nephila pilipes TaxID=299642 RepID=A0A8X6QYC1_NEPPI|nr:hypothetical protein NPIL_29221 [Nephila pilipes]